MSESRTFNAKRNIIWGVIEKIITLFLPFLTRTLIIKILGEQYLGLGSLFSSVIQVLNLTELGFGSAMVFHMYKYVANEDDNSMCALLAFYRHIYHIMGALIFVVGLIILPFIPHFIAGEIPSDINVYVLYLIYLLTTVMSYWLFAYKNSILYAKQRTDLQSTINSSIQIVISICQVIGLVVVKNYYIYAIWILVSTILKNIVTAVIVNKKYPTYVCKGTISTEEKQSIIAKLKALVGHKLGGVVLSAADNIVISAFLGLTTVARYNNYFYLYSAVSGLLTIIYNSISAGIGNSIAKETLEKNYKDFQKFSFLNIWIVSWCSICFACLYQPFISLWLGEEFLFPTETMLLFVMYFFVNHMRKIVLLYKDSAGLWEVDALKPYVESIFNVIVNIILVNLIGINGVLISSILALLIIDTPWEVYALFKAYFIEMHKKKYYYTIAKYIVIFLIAGILTYIFSIYTPFKGIIKFLILCLECLIIPNIFVYLIIRKNLLCIESIGFMRKAIKSRKNPK